ncbi:hypothetical protein [Aeromicrobium sp.]|uniref:hypothetical protein n=1 Tax=Aeromicrobium sp. TaxID=1871063 RepID=UPI0030BEA91A
MSALVQDPRDEAVQGETGLMGDPERGLVADMAAPVDDLDAALAECPVDRETYGPRHQPTTTGPRVQREADVGDR